jgi:predicted PurR-regulated permease PerM
MSKNILSRLWAIVLILCVVIAGINYEETSVDSLFSYIQAWNTQDSSVSVMTKITSELENRFYLEETSTQFMEGMGAIRQSSGNEFGSLKLRQIINVSILLIVLCLLLFYSYISNWRANVCHNQYIHRTIKYIHLSDGKNQIIKVI